MVLLFFLGCVVGCFVVGPRTWRGFAHGGGSWLGLKVAVVVVDGVLRFLAAGGGWLGFWWVASGGA